MCRQILFTIPCGLNTSMISDYQLAYDYILLQKRATLTGIPQPDVHASARVVLSDFINSPSFSSFNYPIVIVFYFEALLDVK